MKIELSKKYAEIFDFLDHTSNESIDEIVESFIEKGLIFVCLNDMPLHKRIRYAFTSKSNMMYNYINELRVKGHKRAIDIYGSPMISESLLQGIRIKKHQIEK